MANHGTVTHEHLDVFADNDRVDILCAYDPSSENPADVVFLHGWGLSPKSYQASIDAIAKRGYRVWAPALPGFGKSAALPDSLRDTYRRTADRMYLAVDGLGLTSPIPMVGHSFGAGLSVSIAHAHPDRVSQLVLVSPIGGAGASVTTWVRLIAGLRHEVQHNTFGRAVDAIPSFVRNPVALAASGIAAKHADLIDNYTALTTAGVPITVIAADHDEVVPIGGIPRVPGLTVHTVCGTHGWILGEPDVAGLLIHQALSPAG